MKNNKGFTIIEGLLILVILAGLGFIGWYVWNTNNKTLDSLADTDSANNSIANVSKTKDATADWVAFSNKDGQFSGKHPKTWVEASNPESCNSGLLLLGANSSSVGKCATESFGQMNIASVDGDSSKDAELKTGYKDITTTSVTINNVKGIKMTATASGQEAEGAPGALADGTKVTKYIFFTNGRTYTATYIGASTYPDALSDFNLMVTKTLKFSA